MKRLVLFLGMLTALLPAGIAAAPVRKAVAVDWTKVVTRTPQGTFVQGNPKARVKLAEYLSFTCPHCALFEKEAVPLLTAKYVRTGLVSYEVRHAMRDPFDIAATILARCGGGPAFFANAPVVYAQQEAWLGKGSAWVQTNPKLEGLPPEQALGRIAAGAGLDVLFAARGIAPAQQHACFAETAGIKRLAAASDAIWATPNFPGTPAFDIDGKPAPGIATWADLDTRLAAALR